MLRLLVIALFAQGLWAQLPPPDCKEFLMPSDKTPEQTVALVSLNFGIREFNRGARERALRYFPEAKLLDPNLVNARLYLATTYAAQYVPGDSSPENQKNSDKTISEFEEALAQDSGNLSALDGLGSLRYQMAATPFNRELFLESKGYFQKHTQLVPGDVEPYYWIGAIDWTLSFHANREVRTRLKQTDNGPLPSESRELYLREYGAIIQEGIDSLQKALSLNPDYDDAMAYLNLLYRRKADTVQTQTERERLIKIADDLVDRAKEIKARRIEPAASPGKQRPELSTAYYSLLQW
jgi:tetratricopeptide (TPR) repeat protein